jgi:hypothetical protein
MEKQQVVQTEEVYFVPPPINELNKNYYQQLSSPDNPIHHATKSYLAYNELLPLDPAQNLTDHELITRPLKENLKSTNRAIYAKMLEYLNTLSGQSPLEGLKPPAESTIKKEILHFMSICEAVKRYETRREVCRLMGNETRMLEARTTEIFTELQRVKDALLDSSRQQNAPSVKK